MKYDLLLEEHKKSFYPQYYTIAGTQLFGMATADSDYDYIGISIEPPEKVIGLQRFEQFEWKLPEHDMEGTTYSLRKFCSLILNGNPTIITTLYSPYAVDELGITTEAFTKRVLSKRAAKAFIGYMQQQIKRIHTTQGMHITRAALIDKYGYDTKYAMHVLRLGLQAKEYLSHGKLTLPMEAQEASYLLDVRNGSLSFDLFLTRANDLLEEVREAEKHSTLPDEPDRKWIDNWLVQKYLTVWGY